MAGHVPVTTNTNAAQDPTIKNIQRKARTAKASVSRLFCALL
jgi:hypothetical protein